MLVDATSIEDDFITRFAFWSILLGTDAFGCRMLEYVNSYSRLNACSVRKEGRRARALPLMPNTY